MPKTNYQSKPRKTEDPDRSVSPDGCVVIENFIVLRLTMPATQGRALERIVKQGKKDPLYAALLARGIDLRKIELED